MKEASCGHLDVPWPAQVNRLVWEGGHDLVLSIGQVAFKNDFFSFRRHERVRQWAAGQLTMLWIWSFADLIT